MKYKTGRFQPSRSGARIQMGILRKTRQEIYLTCVVTVKVLLMTMVKYLAILGFINYGRQRLRIDGVLILAIVLKFREQIWPLLVPHIR